MDGTQWATIIVAVITAMLGPYALAKLNSNRDAQKERTAANVEDRSSERAILQKQLETLLAEQNGLRESLRQEIRERDEAIKARDERIRLLDDRISIVEETLLQYQAGRISPAGYALVPVAYVLQWRRGELPQIPPERFVGEPQLDPPVVTMVRNPERRNARGS